MIKWCQRYKEFLTSIWSIFYCSMHKIYSMNINTLHTEVGKKNSMHKVSGCSTAIQPAESAIFILPILFQSQCRTKMKQIFFGNYMICNSLHCIYIRFIDVGWRGGTIYFSTILFHKLCVYTIWFVMMIYWSVDAKWQIEFLEIWNENDALNR